MSTENIISKAFCKKFYLFGRNAANEGVTPSYEQFLKSHGDLAENIESKQFRAWRAGWIERSNEMLREEGERLNAPKPEPERNVNFEDPSIFWKEPSIFCKIINDSNEVISIKDRFIMELGVRLGVEGVVGDQLKKRITSAISTLKSDLKNTEQERRKAMEENRLLREQLQNVISERFCTSGQLIFANSTLGIKP